LKTAFTNAGYTTLVEDYAATTTSDRLLIYRVDFSAATYGSIFLENRITSGRSLTSRISTGWDTTTHTATGFTSAYTSSISLGAIAKVTFTAINHPELRLVIVEQGTTTATTLGIIRPGVKPDWWLESSHPFAWTPQTSTMLNFLGFTGATTQNPYASTAPYPLIYVSALAANSPGNKPDAIAGIAMILSPTNRSWAGIFTNEVALCSTTGKRGDMIGDFLLLGSGISALAVRSNVPA
jgi:hypothetical protein